MKKTLLSLVTISAIATTGALASSDTDIAELKAMMQQMNKRLAKLEAENKQLKAQVSKKKKTATHHASKSAPAHKYRSSAAKDDRVAALEEKVEKLEKQTPVFSKSSKLKFSGLHYLGFVHGKHTEGGSTPNNYSYNDFETRRNYIQVKGYFFDNPKSYARVTLDTAQKDNGDWEVRLKYAYLYLDNVLPYTGVEFGQAHRPWIDYEEHHGWLYRSIAKTFVERGHDADFTNSADLGINFKTKTEYFSSELGIFNGEGYHGLIDNKDDNNGLSYEWRLTANLLGTGKKHVHKDDKYADISFYGQYNKKDGKRGETVNGKDGDFVWYGFNAVYNQPEFLIAANYLKATKAADGSDLKAGATAPYTDKDYKGNYKGHGWSVNGELRLLTFSPELDKWNLIGRYDDWSLDSGAEKKTVIAGVAYKWSDNIEFILNYDDYKAYDDTGAFDTEDQRVLFTAEVNW